MRIGSSAGFLMAAVILGIGVVPGCGHHQDRTARRIVALLRANADSTVVRYGSGGERTTINYRFDADGAVVRVAMDRWRGSSANTLEAVALPVDAIDPEGVAMERDPTRLPAAWGLPEKVCGDRHRVTIRALPGRRFERIAETREARFRYGGSRFEGSGKGGGDTVNRVVVWTVDRAHALALVRGIRDALR